MRSVLGTGRFHYPRVGTICSDNDGRRRGQARIQEARLGERGLGGEGSSRRRDLGKGTYA